MCEPVTIMAISSLALGVMSSTATAFGQIQAGKAAEEQADFQAKVARNNAITFRLAADDAYDRGEIIEGRFRQQALDLMGRQRAAFASNGILLGEGSALTVLEDTAELTELDALTIRNNAEREAMGLQSQSNNFLSQSQLFQNVAASAGPASRLSAFSTVLGAAGSTLSTSTAFKQTGIF